MRVLVDGWVGWYVGLVIMCVCAGTRVRVHLHVSACKCVQVYACVSAQLFMCLFVVLPSALKAQR